MKRNKRYVYKAIISEPITSDGLANVSEIIRRIELPKDSIIEITIKVIKNVPK